MRLIAEKQPTLVGQLIDPETYHFYSSNIFHLNGERMLKIDEMDQTAHNGDRLVLLSIFSGGDSTSF